MMMNHPKRQRTLGSTILETVIAFFIIAGGMVVIAGIYATTMGTQAEDVEAAVMVTLAESRMADLRAQSTNFADYQALNSATGSVPSVDSPGFQVQTVVTDTPVAYPCTGLQSTTYSASYKKVTVRVTGPGGRTVALSSLIGEPRREAGTVVVTGPTSGPPLAKDASADFVGRLDATDGTPIADVQFRFYIDFGRGYGRIEEQPDGITVTFWNQIQSLAGPNLYTGNEIRIIGRTYYAGQEYRGVSNDLQLAGP